MNKRNLQRELDQCMENLNQEGKVPSLLLHSCCAPCSSYVLEYLSRHFNITLFYYNPNIYPEQEYRRRVTEQKRLIGEMNLYDETAFLEGAYDTEKFREAAKGLENEPEGGERCSRCYELRLRAAAEKARELKADYYTTTLSVSPRKNAQTLAKIGERLAAEYEVHYLPSDFKKKDGCRRSVALSREYGLYRQNYCGCVFSDS